MNSNFEQVKLGDVLTLQRGFDITKREQEDGEIPVVSSSGVSSYHKHWKVKGPGVVIGRKGTLGTVHFVKSNFWPHDTTLWIKDFRGNDPRFLSYFLQTLKLENFDVGASNPTLNRNHVHGLKIIFPRQLETQRKIAGILSAYDELIETNARRIARLEQLAEEIYREWFVRFRFPGYREAEFVKGVPKGWELIPINEFVEFQSGYSFKSETYNQSGRFGIVTIKNVHDGRFVSQCTDFIDEPPSNMKKYCNLQEGDILMSLTGNVGRVCHVCGTNLLLNQRVSKLKPINSEFASFVYWFFRQENIQTLAEMISTGAAQQNLSPIKLGNQKVFVPNRSLLKRFEEIVSPINQQILKCNAMSQKLAQTRDLLLPRLLSGKLDVAALDVRFPPRFEE